MDRYTAIVAMTAMIIGGVIVVTIISSLARMWTRRASKTAGNDALAGIDARLERIEQAVDSMAVEMERVSEGQRFTTKLLSERQSEKVLEPRR
ncbi:MAG: hypothetical protein ABI877_01490 [Gemmatimonadaceae bacterium]